jgi:2-amino-4-hydroxy-6-hydroxymethyldihydropteridine diphosphokinase/dihydropteroate synthase
MNNYDYVYIALGSNLGDRRQNLIQAIDRLVENGVQVVEISPLYVTSALLLKGSPDSWNIPFYNTVIKVDTNINPFELLKLCKKIEAEMGHSVTEKWAPRFIDLDIIHYKGEMINTNELIIPHNGLKNRGFWHDCLSFIFPEIAKVKYGGEHQSLIMGILNITPDSFSDGGTYNNYDNFKETFDRWNEGNVHIIDIGAESTRHGAEQITFKEERERLNFVFDYIKQYKNNKNYFSSLLSLDSYHAETATLAVENGFDLINDVSGLENRMMIELAQGNEKIKFVFMHSLTVPANKNVVIPDNVDVISEVSNWLEKKLEKFDKFGIKREQLIFDFGLGFGKTSSQSLKLLQNIKDFYKFKIKILVGHSRKSFMNIFTKENDRNIETLAISSGIYNEVDILRVHTPLEHQRMILASEHLNNQFI